MVNAETCALNSLAKWRRLAVSDRGFMSNCTLRSRRSDKTCGSINFFVQSSCVKSKYGIYSHLIKSTACQTMSESPADLSLTAALRVMAPLVELLLREGVTYPRFANALKKTFLESATQVLEAGSARVNDSSLSTLTGIHRKDVREWRAVGQPRPQAKTFSAVMELFTRWANDPDYCDPQGRPRVLDRTGGPGSFEALAATVSRDVHPRTLLQELIRLGVANVDDAGANDSDDKVSLCMDAFVPKEGSAE